MGMLELGETAPDFQAPSTAGELGFHDWLGDSWGIFFSYPKAFTSVCSMELISASRLLDDAEAANVKLAALSLDVLEDQGKFAADLEAEEDCPALRLTQIADPEAKVANLYGMVHANTLPDLAVRVLYVIDPERKVRLAQAYPPKVERNFAEVLAAIATLQSDS